MLEELAWKSSLTVRQKTIKQNDICAQQQQYTAADSHPVYARAYHIIFVGNTEIR